MLFDSHCHLNFPEFADSYEQIIADCLSKNIGVINIGTNIETSREVVELASIYPTDPIYAAIGLHPTHASETEFDEREKDIDQPETEFIASKYQALLDSDSVRKIVGVGEIGLDYFHLPEGMDLAEIKRKQKQVFLAQLDFASENNLPVIIHARGSRENPEDAYRDILNILSSYKLNGVIHCFGSTLEIAQKFISLGFYIGFTGIITFKNKSVDQLREVVKNIPLEKILVETDAPYLSPEPYRGQKNTPQYVEYVAQKVAEIKKNSLDEVKELTTENVKKLFKL